MEHQGKSSYRFCVNGAQYLLYRLTGDQVNGKRLLSSWTLHFAAKKTAEVVP